MSTAAADLQVALLSTGLVQPIDVKAKAGKVEVLCRLVPGQEKAWVAVMDKLLSVAEQLPVGELHVCRRYVRRNGSMVFGYHIGLDMGTAKSLKAGVEALVQELRNAKPDLTPVEAPAPRAPAPRPAAASTSDERPTAPKSNGFGTPPPNFDPSVKVVEQRRDGAGFDVIVEEMPLPHVYRELNKPDPAKGRDARGARTISSTAR